MKVDIADGKYSFILNSTGLITGVLRHGEYWPKGCEDFKYNNCVTAMLNELVELRGSVQRTNADAEKWRSLQSALIADFKESINKVSNSMERDQ